MAYVILFLAGALICNAIPHLTSGLRGETFHTPWARPRGIGHSSALENFLWGAANLLGGLWLRAMWMEASVPYAASALAAGFVAAGIGLSLIFSRRRNS